MQLREQWTRKDPRGKRGARLPAMDAPEALCRTGEVCYGGWEKCTNMYHRAIAFTDRHPFLISRQNEKIRGSLRSGKGSHLSFALDTPDQEIPPAFEGWGRWRKQCICIRMHAYIETLGGVCVFNSAMAFTCRKSFQCMARGRLELVFSLF